MKKVIVRFIAVIGVICGAWVALALTFFVVMTISAGFKTVEHDGQDSLSQVSVSLLNLPVWSYVVMMILIAFSALYIFANRKMLANKFSEICEILFEE